MCTGLRTEEERPDASTRVVALSASRLQGCAEGEESIREVRGEDQ